MTCPALDGNSSSTVQERATRNVQGKARVAYSHVELAPGKAVLGYKSKKSGLLYELGRIVRVMLGEADVNRAAGGIPDKPDEQDAEIVAFIMRRAGIAKYFIIPVESIVEVDDEYIRVQTTGDDLAHLPHYELRPDEDIRLSVRQAFAAESPSCLQHITIVVVEGVVHLTGFAATIAVKLHAGELARLVSGVIAVKNEIIVETEDGETEEGAP